MYLFLLSIFLTRLRLSSKPDSCNSRTGTAVKSSACKHVISGVPHRFRQHFFAVTFNLRGNTGETAESRDIKIAIILLPEKLRSVVKIEISQKYLLPGASHKEKPPATAATWLL